MEETKGCWLKCLKCDQEPKYYANPAKFHKLCADHSILQNENLTCSDCQSSVNVYNVEQINCDLCGCAEDVNLLCCGHNLCNLCYVDKCKFCLSICFRCESGIDSTTSPNLQSFPCGHYFCNRCKTDIRNQCIYCTQAPCNICQKGKASLLIKNCEDCIGPCPECTKVSKTKYLRSCKHMFCEYCPNQNKTFCFTCGSDACPKCLIKGSCKDPSHLICTDCSNYRLRCLVCLPDQKCSKCNLYSATRECNNKHLNCKECIPKQTNQIFCALCEYACCVCEIVFGLESLGELTQRNCGHFICIRCLSLNPEKECRKCPSIRSKCYKCKREISFDGNDHNSGKNLGRTGSGSFGVRKCAYCHEKICNACGGCVSFWTGHTCEIKFN